MNWAEVFSAGLVGSLLTLIITKGFEHIGKKQDNSFQLRRIYFEKMLVAGEKAIGQMSLMYGAFLSMSTIFRNVLEMESDTGNSYSDEVMRQHTDKLLKLQEDIERLIQPTLLYFDVEDLLYQVTSISSPQFMIDEFGQRKDYILALAAKWDADPDNADLDKEMDLAEAAFRQDVQGIADMFESHARTTEAIIVRIKDQLRRHRIPD